MASIGFLILDLGIKLLGIRHPITGSSGHCHPPQPEHVFGRTCATRLTAKQFSSVERGRHSQNLFLSQLTCHASSLRLKVLNCETRRGPTTKKHEGGKGDSHPNKVESFFAQEGGAL